MPNLNALTVESPCAQCQGTGRQRALSGELLRKLRKELPKPGISGRGLARKLCLKPTYWNDVERGARPLPERHAIAALEVLRALGWESAAVDDNGPPLVQEKRQRRPQGAPK